MIVHDFSAGFDFRPGNHRCRAAPGLPEGLADKAQKRSAEPAEVTVRIAWDDLLAAKSRYVEYFLGSDSIAVYVKLCNMIFRLDLP